MMLAPVHVESPGRFWAQISLFTHVSPKKMLIYIAPHWSGLIQQAPTKSNAASPTPLIRRSGLIQAPIHDFSLQINRLRLGRGDGKSQSHEALKCYKYKKAGVTTDPGPK